MRKHMARDKGGDRNFNDRNENRNFRGGDFRGGFNNAPRKSFSAICSDCNANCDLPFKPVEGRPVYCRDCFSKHKK